MNVENSFKQFSIQLFPFSSMLWKVQLTAKQFKQNPRHHLKTSDKDKTKDYNSILFSFFYGNKSFIDRKSTMCLQWKTHCTWNKYNQIKWKIYNSLAVTTYKRSWSIISPQIISMQHLSSIIFSVFSHYQLLKSCSQAIANPKNVTSLGNFAPQKFPQGNLTTKSPLRPS